MKAGLIVLVGIGLLSSGEGALAESDALGRLRHYIELDTTNPPGNEALGMEFFSQIFDAAGIAYETAESAPGRGNIWARLDGGDEPGLILLHHMDVVPAVAEDWDTPPLSAVVSDGDLFGRGSIDAKSLGIMHLEAFLALHRSGVPLKRDVVFLATADEEAGGSKGAGWLIENRPEIFAGAGYLLNEGGIGIEAGGKTRFQIEVAQKRPCWLRLTATDRPGHGSSPRPTYATTRLIGALNRIHEQPFAPRVVPAVRDMFRGIAPYVGPDWQATFSNIDDALLEPGLLDRLQAANHRMHAMLRNTCSITVLSGSPKINVIPQTASAELDCRILPDQDAGEFLEALKARIVDEQITVEEIMVFAPSESSPDTDLFRLLEATTRKHFPDAGVLPSVLGAFTDSHYFRELGIVSYGYAPIALPITALGGIHGNNERIPIDRFDGGVEIMTEIVAAFAAGP